MSQKKILIVEDDDSFREALCDTLEDAGFRAIAVSQGDQALELLETESVSMVLTDVHMDSMNGHTLLKQIKKQFSDIPVLLMTAFGTIEDAVAAMREGAVDYIVKPFEADSLIASVQSHLVVKKDEDAVESQVVAQDERMQNLLRLARKVAATEVTVLLSGESGTGKEVFARYIHSQSNRARGPFVAINCAAIPENMLESILFGYEKGSFTGAVQASAGKFEQAQGGTLLLDEISEMDIGLQAKLLRVLQEKEVERLGAKKPVALNVRVLATTNRNLREAVKLGHFREDLYYRLNVFPLNLPPLRERRSDIYPLAKRFVSTFQPQPVKFTKAAIKAMEAHDWTGNVRELENLLQRALILMDDNCIDQRDLQFEPFGTEPQSPREEESTELSADLRSREHRMIIEALEEGRGSRKWAADRLGISPRTLRYKLARMREAGIQVPA